MNRFGKRFDANVPEQEQISYLRGMQVNLIPFCSRDVRIFPADNAVNLTCVIDFTIIGTS